MDDLSRFSPKAGGDYIQRVFYEYVGDGEGDFDQEGAIVEAPPSSASLPAAVGLFALVIALLVVLALAVLLRPSPGEPTGAVVDPVSGPVVTVGPAVTVSVTDPPVYVDIRT